MLAICAAALTGCQDKQQPAETPKLEVTSESPLVFSDIEETKTIEIIANNAWEAADDAEWLTVEPAKGEASSEKQIIEVTAERNKGAERPAVITIKSAGLTKTVEVRQNKVVYADFSVDETPIQALATDEVKIFSVTAGEGVEWTVTSENATVVAPENGEGTGNGTVTLSFPANEDVENGKTYTAVVSTTALVETDSYTVTINQAAAIFVPMLEVSTSEIPALVKAEGENLTFGISSNIAWEVTATEGAVVSPESGANSMDYVRLDILANTESVEKTHTITVSPAEGVEGVEPKTFTVKQAAAEIAPYFKLVGTDPVEVAADATSATFTIESNYDQWTVESNSLQAYAPDDTPYDKTHDVTVTFSANTSSSPVEYTFTIKKASMFGSGPSPLTVTVKQAAAATQPAEKSYIKVTESLTDWSGQYLIVNDAAEMAFNTGLAALTGKNQIAVTISDNKIVSDATTDAAAVTIEKRTSGNDYFLKAANGKYIYYSGYNIGSSDTGVRQKISYDSSYKKVKIEDYTSGKSLQYSPDDSIFRWYDSYGGYQPIQLYKLQ